MKNILKATLIALTLSSTLVLADNTTNRTLDINKVLPKTITTIDNPVHPRVRKATAPTYSPLQKARIVGLSLKSN